MIDSTVVAEKKQDVPRTYCDARMYSNAQKNESAYQTNTGIGLKESPIAKPESHSNKTMTALVYNQKNEMNIDEPTLT